MIDKLIAAWLIIIVLPLWSFRKARIKLALEHCKLTNLTNSTISIGRSDKKSMRTKPQKQARIGLGKHHKVYKTAMGESHTGSYINASQRHEQL